MGYANKIILIISFTAIHSVKAITSKTSYPKDFRRHTGPKPPTDWEPGLREAAHQALIRERLITPNLHDNLLQAPIIGRQIHASPFGDIAILARGQLFSTPNGYQFVQDPYQNDCVDCHERCTAGDCVAYKSRGAEELVALWSVKRIRHRDTDVGHRYELEYTISPMAAVKTGYLTRQGSFNYAIPGHVFIVKVNPKGVGHNIFKVFSPEKEEFITNANRAAQWYQEQKFTPIAKPPISGSESYPTRSYVPGDRLNHAYPKNPLKYGTKPNHRYLPQYYPAKTTVQTHYSVPTPDQEEVDLYKNLVQSLAQKTSTTNFLGIPTKSTYPHRFGPPTKGTTPYLPPTQPTYHENTILTSNGPNIQTTNFQYQSSQLPTQTSHITVPTNRIPLTTNHISIPFPTNNIPIPTNFIPIHTSNLPTQSTGNAQQDHNVQQTTGFIPIQAPYTTSLIPISIISTQGTHSTQGIHSTQPTLFIPASDIPSTQSGDAQSTYLSTYTPAKSTKATYATTQHVYHLPTDQTKPVPTFFIDPTHKGYPKTTPTTPFYETAKTERPIFTGSPDYTHYSEPDPTYLSPTVPPTTYRTDHPIYQTEPTYQTDRPTTIRPPNRLPFNHDRYIPPTTPHYITIPQKPIKPNTPFTSDEEDEDLELFPEDRNKFSDSNTPLVSTESSVHSTVSPKPTEGFLLRDDEYVPKKGHKIKEDVEVFDPTTKNPDIEIISPQTVNTKDIDEVFGNFTTSKPQTDEREFDEFFSKPATQSTEATTQPVKIIYSDFFDASTTIRPDSTTTYAPTSQSYSTSISYEVNNNKAMYKKARVTELKREDNYTIYKAEPEFTTAKEESNTSEATFDDLALSLVNHARSIDYLEAKTKKPKLKRKSYTRVRKLKKRIEQGVHNN